MFASRRENALFFQSGLSASNGGTLKRPPAAWQAHAFF